ncbi:DUF2818 family protein [Pseudoduganella sp. FT55W]|uniref:DUF2818 family protein n=1 Tax=Duganella rivi TaxID=2666083 RepID=A0A7X4GPJ6_9BURK|nr:DUF2818 family protein [Duganella rivi]MYM67320.1 DUF2818 family protein [Duganella rivi]
MNLIHALVLNLMLAMSFANLPFLRLVAVRRWSVVRNDLLGWALGYVLWMGASGALENAAGQPAAKNWEIWAITLALFAVLAFPGIVWRYLR